MQAIENKNKKIKQSYKKSNYRYNNINDWRNQILRIDWLRLNVLFGNKASSIRPHEPYINKKKKQFLKEKGFLSDIYCGLKGTKYFLLKKKKKKY